MNTGILQSSCAEPQVYIYLKTKLVENRMQSIVDVWLDIDLNIDIVVQNKIGHVPFLISFLDF